VLLQADDFWNGSFVYLVGTGEVREVSDFEQSSKTLTWLEPVASAVSATDAYEIWSTWTPPEVHAALNQALRDAWPFFFTVDIQHLVIQEDVGVSYSLSGLSPAPRRVAQLQLESVDVSSSVGQVTDVVAQNRLKDTAHTFTSADVGKEIRIYAGTSQGDRRTISSLIDANTVEVSANFTSILATTSKWRMVDIVDHAQQYSQLLDWTVDSDSNPSTMYLSSHPYALEGFLLRLVCESEYATLSTDASTTTAPDEYVELATLARLYLLSMAFRPESELNAWAALQTTYAEAAEQYAMKHQMRHMPGQITDDSWPLSVPGDYPFTP
jgi:hypothetical protein